MPNGRRRRSPAARAAVPRGGTAMQISVSLHFGDVTRGRNNGARNRKYHRRSPAVAAAAATTATSGSDVGSYGGGGA